MAGLQVAKVAVDKPVDKELGRFWVMAREGKSKPYSKLHTVQLQTDSPTYPPGPCAFKTR